MPRMNVRLSPGVVVPLYAVVSLWLGALGAIASCFVFLGGFASLCAVLPFISLSSALGALFLWNLRNVPALHARRTSILVIALAVYCVAEAIRCRN